MESVIGGLLVLVSPFAVVVQVIVKEGLLGPLLLAQAVVATRLSGELSPRHELYVCGGTSSLPEV